MYFCYTLFLNLNWYGIIDCIPFYVNKYPKSIFGDTEIKETIGDLNKKY